MASWWPLIEKTLNHEWFEIPEAGMPCRYSKKRCTITVVALAATWLTMARQTGCMNSIVTEIAEAGKGRSQDITWVGFNPA